MRWKCVGVKLPFETLNQLRNVATEKDITISEILREAIATFLESCAAAESQN
ncbi:MAG: hypothetical protein Fur0046_17580 [Cyanobacteria bacterium J069]